MPAHRSLRRLARLGLSGIFLYAGSQAARDPGGRAQAPTRIGLPASADLVRANGAAMVLGGAALALGILPRLAAAGLIASLVPTTLAGHAFWAEDDAQRRRAQALQLAKNGAIIGGLLLVIADGP